MTPQEQAREIAQELLDSKIPLVEACRRIQCPLDELGLGRDGEFTIFVGIVSEADEFPLGSDRRHWNKDALAKKDTDFVKFEYHFRPFAEKACRAVLRMLIASS